MTPTTTPTIPPTNKPARRWQIALALFVTLAATAGASSGLTLLALDRADEQRSATSTTCDPRPYCERHPDHCSPCAAGVGQCGGEPLWVCCDLQTGGCVGVATAAECPATNDIIGQCDWGRTTTTPDGLPAVECFE
jgi:hypothetical protein